MTLKQFLDLYDDHNGDMILNDNNLKSVISGSVSFVKEFITLQQLKGEVISFGFYDDCLTVRIK